MALRRRVRLRHLGHLLEAVAVIPCGWLLAAAPWRLREGFSRAGGWAAYHLDRRNKAWARRNLDIIFPRALSPGQREAILRRLYRNVAAGVFEFFQLRGLSAQKLVRFVRVKGYEAVDRARARGKGVVVMTAHLGNWEVLGCIGPRFGYPVAAVIKRQHNPYTDRWLRRFREKHAGVRCFYPEEAVLPRIARHLARNGVLAMLVDQAYLDNPIFVPFFGLPSATSAGPAKIHLWFEAPLVLAFALKRPDGNYDLIYEGPYDPDRRRDLRADAERVMGRVYRRFESFIRAHPDQWFSLLTPRWRLGPEDFRK